jgi:Putative Ig domain
MMFYCLSYSAQKCSALIQKCSAQKEFGARRRDSYRNNGFHAAGVITANVIIVLCGILSFNACGGPSTHSNSTTAPTTVTPNANLTVSSTLPAGTVGTSYSSTLTVTGGTAPYTFSAASGQLPAGVTLGDSTGTISGTPTASGNFNFSVSVADSKGDSKDQALQMTVASAPPASNPPASNPPASNPPASNPAPQNTAPTFSNLQRTGGWGQYGQGPPNFVDCSPSPCDGISFWMAQEVSSPSMSGHASEFNVGGWTPYSDALWNNHLIGPGSTQGMPDGNQTMVPSLHDFTYDVYFYGDNLGLAQALEFDINQFFDNKGFIFGHECRIASGNEWDVWDAQHAKWTPTGIPCYPNSNSWNHLTIKVQRTSNNELTYQSITLNGQTSNLGWTYYPGSTAGWYGVTINFQMDGNQNQDSYNVYLDNLNFSYQ